nr:hypothetical protein [Sulfurimonas sp. SAG-AH-194-C20]
MAVPVVYATDEAPRKGIHYIDLIEHSKETLLNIYEKENNIEKF